MTQPESGEHPGSFDEDGKQIVICIWVEFSTMNKKKLAELTAQLKTQHEKTLDKLAHLRQELSIQADDDAEEQASDLAEHELVLGRIQDLEIRLQAIEHARQRAAQGKYGICENCGQAIDPARLEIIPEIVLCVRCKTTGEQLTKMKTHLSKTATTSTRNS
jgi:RNA polymerase-binding transcription factor DksA